MFRYFVIKCFLMLLTIYALGQSQDINLETNLPKVIPVSPTAASLGKFGEIPISKYTGIPNISVPLYTVALGDLQIPIVMNYHAGGIKVEEMASWVGLGWSLSAGGAITRTQRGLPDEEPGIGYMATYLNAKNYYNGLLTESQKDQYRLDVFHGNTDSESDFFFFNFPGGSGKFFFTDNGQLITSPRSDLRIEFITTGWVLTTGNGTRYIFKDYETTQSEPYSSVNGGALSDGNPSSSNNAWYLTDVVSMKGDSIHFKYENTLVQFKTSLAETRNVFMGIQPTCPPTSVVAHNVVQVTGKQLKEIEFNSNKVVFLTKSGTRLDNSSDIVLEKIAVINANSDTVKQFKLFTSYFSNVTVGGGNDINDYRLRLDSLCEVGKFGSLLKPYAFSYNATPLPRRLSFAKDYWGYYNGVNNTTSVRYLSSLSTNATWLGANKEPDSTFAKACVLEKLTYPTGGRTEFVYEGNTYAKYYSEGFDLEDSTFVDGLSGNNTNHQNNYLLTFQKSFTIPSSSISPSGYLLCKTLMQRSCANTSVVCYVGIKVVGPNGYQKDIVSSQDTLRLLAGTYTIQASIETEFAGNPYADFAINIYKYAYKAAHYKNKLFGGLRVKTIKYYDAIGLLPKVQRYSYGFFSDPQIPDTISSGIFSPIPDYSYQKTNLNQYGGEQCLHTVFNSVSNYPLLLTSGSPIGYRNVTVYEGNNGENGKQESTFTSIVDYPDSLDLSFPFPSANERDWRHGLLVKEITYANQNGTFMPVQIKKVNYTFQSSDTTRKYARSLKIGKNIQYIGELVNSDPFNLAGLVGSGYLTVAEAFNVSSDTVIVYAQGSASSFSSNATAYTFSPKNFQLKSKEQKNSEGETTTTNIKYPLDYGTTASSANEAKALYDLKNKNAISIPIEIYVVNKNVSNAEKVTKGMITTFKPNSLLPDSVFNFEVEGGLPLANFSQSAVSTNLFIKDGRYKARIAFNKYNYRGKISEQQKVYDSKAVYLWNYNNEYPVAECVNADSASLAYTSFEADGVGNWTGINPTNLVLSGGLTGKKYYSANNFSLIKNGLSSTSTYTVSYWSKNGSFNVNSTSPVVGRSYNGWTFYQHSVANPVNGTITVAGTGAIDELRLYPNGAQMQTYSYEPLIGIASACDANNRVIYYEYDVFNRLSLIRDQNGNVVKKYAYNYAGQVPVGQ